MRRIAVARVAAGEFGLLGHQQTVTLLQFLHLRDGRHEAGFLGLGLHLLHSKAEAARARDHSLDGQIARITQERQGYQDMMKLPANHQVLLQAQALNKLFEEKTFSWTLAMEDLETVLPGGVMVSTIEPIRDVLLQMFMGEKFGRDPIWEGHLATEIGQAQVDVDAVLYEQRLPLRKMMALNVGDTLMLELKPDAMVTVRCGDVTLTEGRMGKVGDRVAVRVAKQLRRPRTTFAMFEKADEPTNRMEVP